MQNRKKKANRKLGKYKNNLEDFRLKKDLTQLALAEKLRQKGYKITNSYLSQLEAGLKKPSLEIAYAIAAELDSEVDKIFLPRNFTISQKRGVANGKVVNSTDCCAEGD